MLVGLHLMMAGMVRLVMLYNICSVVVDTHTLTETINPQLSKVNQMIPAIYSCYLFLLLIPAIVLPVINH